MTLEQQWSDYLNWTEPDIVCIDNDLRAAIKHLWAYGIKTSDSCAGHDEARRDFYLTFYYDHTFVRYLRLNLIETDGIEGMLWGVYCLPSFPMNNFKDCSKAFLAYRGTDDLKAW